MQYFSSLLLLRIFALWTALLVARDYDVLISLVQLFLEPILGKGGSDTSLNRDAPATGNGTSRGWRNVDIFVPRKLNDSIAEALRLNELLARKQYHCEEDIRTPDDRGAFTVCLDGKPNRTVREALFISGSPDDYASYLITVIPEKWTFFVPDGFQALEKLGNVDAEMNYLFELKDNGVWSADEILYELFHRKFDTAFISFYSPYVGGQSQKARLEELRDALKLTEKVLKVLQSEQLHLVIEIDGGVDELMYEWYSLLYQMYFKYHYALIGAESDSVCDRIVHKCRYRLSFMKRTLHEIELPVFGFGSPLEEKKRLVKYLTTNKRGNVHCDEMIRDENDIPSLCKIETTDAPCTVAYVSYRKQKSTETFEQFQPCKMHFFSPLETNFKSATTLSSYSYGISPHVSKNSTVPGDNDGSNIWSLITLTDILNIAVGDGEKITKLILDLDGGEWDIFPALLETAELKDTVLDLDMRVRFWIGEENENFRRFLMYFLRLEVLGFKKLFSRIVNETTAVVSFRKT